MSVEKSRIESPWDIADFQLARITTKFPTERNSGEPALLSVVGREKAKLS